MEKVYCANCGAPQGLVTADWCPHIFALCNECVAKNGAPPLPELPEEMVRGL